MSNILQANVTIRGTRALLWHYFGPDALPLEQQERSGVAGNDPNEWRKTVLVTKEGQLYIDPTYIFGSVRDGGAYVPRKKTHLKKPIAATLLVNDDRILVKDKFFPGFPNGTDFDVKKVEPPPTDTSAPVFLHVCGVKNPSTGMRNIRYRIGVSAGWELSFGLTWDKTVVSREEMESAILRAGLLVGLGDGRGVGFGRYERVAFQIKE